MTKEELQKLVSSWENLWVVKVNGVDLTPSFPLLMEMALERNDASGWRASWVADKIAWKNRALLAPYCRRIIDALPALNQCAGVHLILQNTIDSNRTPISLNLLFETRLEL